MAADPSFVAWIDEGGDEGFEFALPGEQKKSSEWLSLFATVCRIDRQDRVADAVNAARDLLKRPPKKPLHFRYLNHEQRVAYARTIARSRCCAAVGILVHKPPIKELDAFRPPKLYLYATTLLLERISWLCCDWYTHPKCARPPGDRTVKVVFSEKRNLSCEKVRAHTERLERRYDNGIYWHFVRPDQIETEPHDQHAGLEVADLLASAF
jgi:hypothetical protein